MSFTRRSSGGPYLSWTIAFTMFFARQAGLPRAACASRTGVWQTAGRHESGWSTLGALATGTNWRAHSTVNRALFSSLLGVPGRAPEMLGRDRSQERDIRHHAFDGYAIVSKAPWLEGPTIEA